MANVTAKETDRQATILLVEDDAAVRDVIAQILSAKNFRVLEAGNGQEAMRLLAAHDVDLMMTDIMMPGLNGYQLAIRARLIRPSLRILYTTGNDDGASGREMALSYGKVIPKPLHAEELLHEIQQLLKSMARATRG